MCDVMQQVAVSRLRRLEERLTPYVPLADLVARELLPLLPSDADDDLLVSGGWEGRLLIVMTSDEGLVGPLHSAVIRSAMEKANASTQWILVGQRGRRLLSVQGSVRLMPMPPEDDADRQIHRLADAVLDEFQRQALSDVWLIAPRFLSTMRQDVMVQQLLPLPAPRPLAAQAGLALAPHAEEPDVVLEPSLAAVLQQVASVWVRSVCAEALWSAYRADCAARALHIEDARQELAKQGRRIRYEGFKALHERLDVMVRESCVVRQHAARRALATVATRTTR